MININVFQISIFKSNNEQRQNYNLIFLSNKVCNIQSLKRNSLETMHVIYLSTTDETFDSPGKTPTKSGLSFHKSRSTSSFILSAPHSGASRQAEKSEKILTYAELRNPESRSGLAGRISSVERRSGYIILVVYIYIDSSYL